MAGFLKGKIDATPDVTTEVDLGQGFVCTVRRLSPAARDEVQEARASLGRKGKVQYHRDAAARVWCKRALVDWTGLTEGVFTGLLKMVTLPEHAAAVHAHFKEHGTLAFDLDNAVALFLNANPDAFVTPLVEALDEMWEADQASRDKEEEKST